MKKGEEKHFVLGRGMEKRREKRKIVTFGLVGVSFENQTSINIIRQRSRDIVSGH
jgi:hypothetical protein